MDGTVEYGPVPIRADLSAPRATRRLVKDLEDALGDARDAAELLLSELATNVVVHTDCPALAVSVCIRPESVRFGVSDCEPHHLPAPREPEDGRPGGFGLRLVEQLASEWGVAVDPFGKAVWFELPRVAVPTRGALEPV